MPTSPLSELFKLLRQAPAKGSLVPYPEMRNFVLDVLAEGRRKNTINLILQADVTELLRSRLCSKEDESARVSLTALIAHAFARTIDEDRNMHAYRKGRKQLVIFDEVDLAVMVEREVDGATQPIVKIIRATNRKSPGELHQELQHAKTAPLGEHGPMSALELRFFRLPRWLRRCVWFVIRRNPYWFKDLVGTAGVTSMGMFTNGAAVVQPITPMTLTLSIGGIEKRPALVADKLVERDFIHLNLGADHDIIDGAPLMRFAERLRSRLMNRQGGCNKLRNSPQRPID